MKKLPYNDNSVEDIFRYSKKLENKKFIDILNDFFSKDQIKEEIEHYGDKNFKGGLGNLLEEFYFFYKPNSDSNPDFSKVGMELKVTPYDKTKNGLTKAGERLVITMIPYDKPISKDFIGSHLEKKMKLILMIWYYRQKNIDKLNYKIDYVILYDLYSKMLEKDLEIIKEDYKIIVDKVISGNAHKLSEADTRYLGACTKGSNASKSLQPQHIYNPEVKAKRRAFSLKQSYMNHILNSYILHGKINYDSILKNEDNFTGNFEDKVINKINFYVGKTEKSLYQSFGIDLLNKSKQINRILIYRMLDINTERAEEFDKANIVIKTIRVQKNGKPRESMSFPKIVIKDFVNQEFEESLEYNFFETTRFLFVVFQEKEDGLYVLKGAKFWNMPIDELDTVGKREWESYKLKFLLGVNFEVKKQKSGKIIIGNDLPKKRDNKIFHLRPHSLKSAYYINGVYYGEGKLSDMDELPNGDKMTHQCFWFNNDYIAKIIKDLLI